MMMMILGGYHLGQKARRDHPLLHSRMIEKPKKKRPKTFLAVFKCPDCNTVNDSQKTQGAAAHCEVCGCESCSFQYRCPSCNALNSAPPTRSDGTMWCDVCGNGRPSTSTDASCLPGADLNPQPPRPPLPAALQPGPMSSSTSLSSAAEPESIKNPSSDRRDDAYRVCLECEEKSRRIEETSCELERASKSLKEELAEAKRTANAAEKDSAESITILERDLATFQARIMSLSDEKAALERDLLTLQTSLIEATDAKNKYKAAFEDGAMSRSEEASGSGVHQQAAKSGSGRAKPAKTLPSGSTSNTSLQASALAAPPKPVSFTGSMAGDLIMKALLLAAFTFCVFCGGAYTCREYPVLIPGLAPAVPPTSHKCPACPRRCQSEPSSASSSISSSSLHTSLTDRASKCERREVALERRLSDAEAKAAASITARDACEETRRSAEQAEAAARLEMSASGVSQREAERLGEAASRASSACEGRLSEVGERLIEARASLAASRATATRCSRGGVRGLGQESELDKARVWARFV